MKQIKGIVVLTIFIVLVCVVFISIFYSKNNINRNQKVEQNEEQGLTDKEIKKILSDIGKDFYENFYYDQIDPTDKVSFLSEYDTLGIKVNLKNLYIFVENESENDTTNYNQLNKINNQETKRQLDEENTKVIFYPTSPYEKNSYTMKVKLFFKDENNLVETLKMNKYGDFVGDNLKITYNDKNDITSIVLKDDKEVKKEEFDYSYDDNGLVSRIELKSINEFIEKVDVSYIDFYITYYNNSDKVFSIKMYNNKYDSEQYFLYNERDELSYILQVNGQKGGLVHSFLTEFKYYKDNDIDFIKEKTTEYAPNYGNEHYRVYTKKSTEEYNNNLEKLGIITPLMYEKNLYKLDYGQMMPTVSTEPTVPFYYSNKILQCSMQEETSYNYIYNKYDNNSNYVYSSDYDGYNYYKKSTLYKRKKYYLRKELKNQMEISYKYYLNDKKIKKLEVYNKNISGNDEFNKLKQKYEENNAEIEYLYSPQAVRMKYHSDDPYDLYNYCTYLQKLVGSNGNDYEKYKGKITTDDTKN